MLDSKNSSNKKQINPQNGSNKVQITGNSKENSKDKKEIIITNFSKPVVKDEKEIKPHNSSNALGVNKKNQNNADVFLPKDNLSINQPELKSDNNRTLNPRKTAL